MQLRTRHSRTLVLMLLAATLAVPLAGCGKKSEDSQASVTPANVTLTADQRQHITLYTVAPSRFHSSIGATGVVDFDNDQATSVLSSISGPVSGLLVQPGDKVRKGQPLATVASPDYAAAVTAYAKALVAAQNARHISDADKDMAQHQSVSQREADQAQTDAASAEADRDAALQALVSLDADPQTIQEIQAGRPATKIEGVIRSPITGTVVEKLIQPGQLLQAGTTSVFTVADLSKVWVMGHIFDTDSGSVHVGDTAQVVGPGKTLSGVVDNIAAEVDPNTRSIAVRIVVDNPGEFLKRQMYVQVHILDKQQTSGILIPVSAVLQDDENLPYVYVTQPDGSFARVHVTLGNRTGDQYAITGGLAPGQRLVSDGALFLQFMQQQ